jgi:hypothetical protein
MIVLDKQLHSALHSTVRAMRRNDLVDLSISPPSAVRLVVEMRTEAFDDIV